MRAYSWFTAWSHSQARDSKPRRYALDPRLKIKVADLAEMILLSDAACAESASALGRA
jgi:hypothetical protein